ncbi:MAG: radical SAM protein, partial [Candidatus Eremiobacterota bacterium]
MRVLLMETPFPSPLTYTQPEPLGLELVAGALGQHDVRLLDLRLDPDLERCMQAFRPHVVATGSVAAQRNRVLDLLARARRVDPTVRTVVGGLHPTLYPQDFASPWVDALVCGPGEFTMGELVDTWEQGKSPSEIPGLALGCPGRMVRTPPRVIGHLDDSPRPRRDLTRGYREHYFQDGHRPAAMTRTSLGCAYRCNFCALWKFARGRYLAHSPERVVADIGDVQEGYCFFADADSFLDRRRAARILAGLRQANIRKKYRMFVNAQSVIACPDILEGLAAAGLEEVIVGYEAVDDAGLKAFNKNTTAAMNREATRVLYGLGLKVRAYFLIRSDFTRLDFRRLARYVEEEGLLTPLFTVETPFPGTDLYAAVEDRLITDRCEDFDLLHPTLPMRLSYEEFLKEYRRLLTSSYGPARYLRSLVAAGAVRLRPGWRERLEPRAR